MSWSRDKKLLFWLILIFLVNLFYCWWSYFLTDANLVISQYQVYYQWQTQMWQFLLNNRQTVANIFILITLAQFAIYVATILQLSKLRIVAKRIELNKLAIVWLIIISPLIFSYNALSHDVFNYMFNARMVIKYHADPHVKVALDYSGDLWTRFMHNTHTPAPYYYGWTGLSLVPYLLGFGKFLSTWLMYKFFSVISLGLLFISIQKFAQNARWQLSVADWAIVFLNPLILTEIVANAHNDIWMLAPVIYGLALVIQNKPSKKHILISFLLLVFSASIKYATIVLWPVWLLLVIKNKSTNYQRLLHFVPLVSSALLFLLLFTERSRQFLPWYLSWSLIWLTLINLVKNDKSFFRFFGQVLLCLSLSSIFRYLPWLFSGNYDAQIIGQEKTITWLGGLVLILGWQAMVFGKSRVHQSSQSSKVKIIK